LDILVQSVQGAVDLEVDLTTGNDNPLRILNLPNAVDTPRVTEIKI